MASIPDSASFIRTNNEGVSYFEAGKYNEAIASLQVALVEMRSMLALKQMDGPMSLEAMDTTTSSSSSSSSSSGMDDLAIQSMPLAEPVRKTLGVDNSSTMTFFDRVFRITTSEDSKLLLGENENKTCCLLLYNIGVCHQALGVTLGSQNELSKAFRLYRMALEFLRFTDTSAQNDSVLLMLSLALMNNVAHIQSCFFNYDEMRHCVGWLREAAQHFETSSLCEEDYMFFFLRFFVLPSNEIPTAPAA